MSVVNEHTLDSDVVELVESLMNMSAVPATATPGTSMMDNTGGSGNAKLKSELTLSTRVVIQDCVGDDMEDLGESVGAMAGLTSYPTADFTSSIRSPVAKSIESRSDKVQSFCSSAGKAVSGGQRHGALSSMIYDEIEEEDVIGVISSSSSSKKLTMPSHSLDEEAGNLVKFVSVCTQVGAVSCASAAGGAGEVGQRKVQERSGVSRSSISSSDFKKKRVIAEVDNIIMPTEQKILSFSSLDDGDVGRAKKLKTKKRLSSCGGGGSSKKDDIDDIFGGL
jgi:hypothetical protein